jgi:Sulfotransferase family
MSGQGWSRTDRLLHRLATGFTPFRDISFDIERSRFGKAARAIAIDRPVFVCGLARSGTSLIVRALNDTGQFGALTYRDMPFALAPNSWAAIAGKRRSQSTERDHGDGLDHDLDTPEAIEELFWRHVSGKAYLKADALVPHHPSAAIRAQFRDYIGLVLLRTGKTRYLSKDNNNILRLPAIAQSFPDAIILHPFRDPLQQAASLLNQHRRATASGASDPFRSVYTASLGHHEFGPGHRPFRFGEAKVCGDPQTLDYWLARWIDAHRFLVECHVPVGPQRHFVDFDALAKGGSFAPVFALAGALGSTSLIPAPPALHQPMDVDPELLTKAMAIHVTLVARATGG